ncbi:MULTISPECIES: TetR family transcriptional regulator [unclassified Spirosoma]|uniref:TetR/AcrR family transcriptional regulator n=1 Tax=unclassified Spirosoma TaxID=2621999 RepID=UPI00095CB3D1|nr:MULTISPECIES: TetR family transcriptional regulator [unclassified Spirosoma]MBN8822616.1 TetR/AcrR family transcriptional regulator [Spirosoma sp.]OJW74108.1 MAG: TetR family transcriptional regulator [Spirosoma sp. 48-14]
MRCSPSKNTEERIREAARQVFLEKGFDGTTSRDIAEAAGINIALTNYYFRSKEKLFISIFDELIQLFFEGMFCILNKPIGLREKITELVEHDFQLMKSNPSLCIFVMNEIHRNPERMANAVEARKQFQQSVFDEQLRREAALGHIRSIEAMHLMVMIVSNIQFLFISKAMHIRIWHMSEEAFDAFANRHKGIVIDMITNYLFAFESV